MVLWDFLHLGPEASTETCDLGALSHDVDLHGHTHHAAFLGSHEPTHATSFHEPKHATSFDEPPPPPKEEEHEEKPSGPPVDVNAPGGLQQDLLPGNNPDTGLQDMRHLAVFLVPPTAEQTWR